MIKLKQILFLLACLSIIAPSFAAKLAIVIDDYGYRTHNEQEIVILSSDITVAVLPHSPNAKNIAEFAHTHGNEVIVHLPMAPTTKQPLEVDTLFPEMDKNEVKRIVDQAIQRVPYAIGLNSHMGSLMTSDLTGMQNVMSALTGYDMFFLDSRTTSKSKAVLAAKEYGIPILVRDIFLDDTQSEAAISHQLDLAIQVARKHGQAIAIGHPYTPTLNVLKARLTNLPADIVLVPLTDLIAPREKIKLLELLSTYQTAFEQILFDYLILKQSSK